MNDDQLYKRGQIHGVTMCCTELLAELDAAPRWKRNVSRSSLEKWLHASLARMEREELELR